ncbi:MAG TPA: RNA polymerase sigma factor [Acidobacteriaceae bacterium]|nr:RNA polymerase sigma factor [Acidobacteriaceae bacterium]
MTLAATESEPERIARGLRQRDVALLQTLVQQYQYRLMRYFIFLLGTREAVEDLAQETWLRVLERGRLYDGASRFEPWLFAIARNLAIDHTRKRRVLSLDSNDADDAEPALPSPASSAASPFEQAARSEDAQLLAHSLQLLQPVYREALVLRFQEELSLQEISHVVGASVSTVSSRIYRGLAALRQQMNGGTHAN